MSEGYRARDRDKERKRRIRWAAEKVTVRHRV